MTKTTHVLHKEYLIYTISKKCLLYKCIAIFNKDVKKTSIFSFPSLCKKQTKYKESLSKRTIITHYIAPLKTTHFYLHREKVVGRARHMHGNFQGIGFGDVRRPSKTNHAKLTKLGPKPWGMEGHHRNVS